MSTSCPLILVGHKFGLLIVLHRSGSVNNYVAWRCRCICGVEIAVPGNKLRSGKVTSCQKCASNRIDVVAREEHGIWRGMIDRCYNSLSHAYRNYGRRGIKVCLRWRKSFEQFLSDVGPRPGSEYSIDRFPDPWGNYEPGNVRWATAKQQARNMRNSIYVEHHGKRILLLELAEELGLDAKLVGSRVRAGWDLEKAMMEPRRTWRRVADREIDFRPPKTIEEIAEEVGATHWASNKNALIFR